VKSFRGPIALDEQAYALLVSYKRTIEPSLGPSGDLEIIADWGNKAGGTVVRLAGLLHLADAAWGPPEQHLVPIGEAEVGRALLIADFLCAHSRLAFDLMEADPLAQGARHVLAWIQRTGAQSFTAREVHQANRGRFKLSAEMEPLLAPPL